MAESIQHEHGSTLISSQTHHDHEKIDVQSIDSNEEPIPALEPPPHHHTAHDGGREDNDNDIHYEYLTHETAINLDELPSSPQVSPPNLKKYDTPTSWSSTRKTIILVLCCWCTFSAAYSAGAYSIASDPQRARWHLSSLAFETGVTTWALGFAVSPMFLAPFSEINGRRPVFIASAVIFLAGQIACATTPSFAGMLVARFFVGAGASTFATLIGGVVSDLYTSVDRNTPMAVYSGSALTGTGIGPLCSGFIIGRADYRWVYYHQVINLGVMLVVVVVFFSETRASVLLSRKARVLNEYLEKVDANTGASIGGERGRDNDANADAGVDGERGEKARPAGRGVKLRYKVAADESRSSLAHMLYLSLTIPFKLLATEPVVFFFSLWVAFAWGLLYMTFDVIPFVFTTRHDFNTEQDGAVFASISIGSILATIICIYQEKWAKRVWPKLTTSPEGRLYFACLEAALLPIGLFWFGWTTFRDVPWIAPVLGLGCAQMGIFVIYLAVFNYLADVYHRYASSALAAQSFCRNVLAAVFPLFAEQMFSGLGYGAAASLLGGIAALLTLVPWVLVFNGEKIRARSKIARQIMAQEHQHR
ncbi:hypothetical protein LTR10_013331 [Elasticomyces elasticus]|uniref:Major facilitator superfamily (MFS) profile domain-containing protein n=1 Tax=Exophiala sideris TaxID=1016849 RepID=A0ABR0J4P1_9EURO|nr:hypothetical protein LTR10_013331 [Elasticomyces elasticus]KAK5027440.1 hypothetical protein LTS07_007042 [Exophiala sideris]KAK5034857.1 hypothetical protein LTR13_006039 [Exophiala sideris]KAK5056408.1 hypothetical protein LTR69_007949 [Exophiala sideris]KAK5181103.1 hypothetical protein LTR44_006434 [Eurotiomycetes sp. CCFEE 6388]